MKNPQKQGNLLCESRIKTEYMLKIAQFLIIRQTVMFFIAY